MSVFLITEREWRAFFTHHAYETFLILLDYINRMLAVRFVQR